VLLLDNPSMMESKQTKECPINALGDEHAFTRDYAVILDSQDALGHIRGQFLFPSKTNLKSQTLSLQGLDFFS
jgi:hypothetical protein